MRYLIGTFGLFLLASPAFAQGQAVCDTFTDSEIASVLGVAPTVKRSILGAGNDCVWGIQGLMLTVNRVTDEPETIAQIVESQLQRSGGDTVKAEPGIGDRAVSTQGKYGRSASLVAAAGATAWTFSVEKIDQKLDMPAVLDKLRILARKAVTGGAH